MVHAIEASGIVWLFQNWNEQCFPDWKLKKSPLSRQEISAAEVFVSLLTSDISDIYFSKSFFTLFFFPFMCLDGIVSFQQNKIVPEYEELKCTTNSGDMNDDNEYLTRQSIVTAVVDDRTCHLCW